VHPVGRLASGPQVRVPDGWPTVDGRIGCLTCHDIRRQCDDARRPATNATMLRDHDPDRWGGFCTRCHVVEESQSLSPHRQLDSSGQVRTETCLMCHTEALVASSDGIRRFEPKLGDVSSGVCLRCHARHRDVSAIGHVERPVPQVLRQRLLAWELAGAASPDPDRRPARLPLADGRVACFTCHNPHQTGLFPAGSELGMRARRPADAAVALRVDYMELCLACHGK
jgi:hypothetical protein